jgi:large subunit ribosomal protein L21
MFAVIRTGGKQYKVAAQDVIRIERRDGAPGDTIEFAEVVMLGGDSPVVGAPTVAGATVAGELIEHTRGPKVIAFKKRRRQNSRRKRGHRQDYTLVRITEILTDGRKPAKAAKAPTEADAAPAEAAAKPARRTAAKKAEAGAAGEAAAKPKRAPAKAKTAKAESASEEN